MADIDDWLTSAAGRIPAHVPITTLSALEQRLDGQPSPMAASSRRDTGLSMLCACLAAVVGFSAISGVAGGEMTARRPHGSPPPRKPHRTAC
jgi:hypothetical protein